MRAARSYWGFLLAATAAAFLTGCPPTPPPPGPVTTVTVTASTLGPVNSAATVTFTVAFDAAVTGFDDAATDVQLDHSGTADGVITIVPVDEATYEVNVTGITGNGSYRLVVPEGVAEDLLDNLTPGGRSEPVAVDTTVPVVTVNSLMTLDASPQLRGTVSDPNATVTVRVGRQTLTATNNGDGSWTLPDDTIDPPLTDGTYDVVVTARDAAGNAGTDATTNELTINAEPPNITVNVLITNDELPTITGKIDDPDAEITITILNNTYIAINNGDGTWRFEGVDLVGPLGEGVYDVQVTATDMLDRTGADASSDELTVDLTAPIVTVDPLDAEDPSPELTGTIDDPDAKVTVTVSGQERGAINSGDGTWRLPAGVIEPDLDDGTYDVEAVAVDKAGNTGTDGTTDELAVNSQPPVVTVNRLSTTNDMPDITGTVDDPDASVSVILTGVTYTAANNGDGTWILRGSDLVSQLPDGTYSAHAFAIDEFLRTGTDSTSGELFIDGTAPTVTVTSTTTDDDTPSLSGNVNDPDATIQVLIVGQTLTATNNRNGTWTLANDTIDPPLPLGSHNVTVLATDDLGNVGEASGTVIVETP